MDLYVLGHLGLFFFKEIHTHTHTPFFRYYLRWAIYAANFERTLLCEYSFVLSASFCYRKLFS